MWLRNLKVVKDLKDYSVRGEILFYIFEKFLDTADGDAEVEVVTSSEFCEVDSHDISVFINHRASGGALHSWYAV